MKISTFQARDMREVLKEVKEKLGADAVILSTRSIRMPGGGLTLGRTLIEVTACPGPNARELPQEADPSPPARPEPPVPQAGRPVQQVEPEPRRSAAPLAGRFSRVVDDPVEYAPTARPVPRQERARSPEREETRPAGGYAETETTEPEGGYESTGGAASEDEAPGSLASPQAIDPVHEKSYDVSGDLAGLDAESRRNYSWLLMHGVEEPIARRIVLMDRSGKERGLAVAFQRALKFRDPLAGPARVIALVGPTGVGKTTTLAKIAADLILNRQRSVGMITLDTFRVGAVAQLETYAKLLQVRLVVARAPSEVKAGLSSLNRCDYVLVDTVGSSPYNRRQVNSTASLLPDMGDDREVILCMAANVRETEQQAIYRRFSVLQPTGLIFTKLDETVTYGGILNVCIKANLPLTLYTDGQRVPENLGWMSAKTLSKWFARDTQAEL
ncbi:MAG: flagellar biosynthesis protein FlhF [Magnetococcus sp. MYC-9]